MTRRADWFFVQQQLREMNFDEPAFAQRPALLGAQPESPEWEQFDSAREDVEEEEGSVTSALDAEIDALETWYNDGFLIGLYGGALEGPAPYHPFGSTEGAVGARGEQCFDTYPVPAIYVY